MLILGCKDYDREGKEVRTALFAGNATGDGETHTTKSGKTCGTVSVKAYTRKDGTAAWLDLKTFDPDRGAALASLRKGDSLVAAGRMESREYNGKTYTTLMVDVLLPAGFAPKAGRAPSAPAAPAQGNTKFEELGEGDPEELPF
jgi:single-stranded DNA-binding protein